MDLEAIKQRLESATEGPWEWKYNGTCGPHSLFGGDTIVINLACRDCVGEDNGRIESDADQEFIAHAREDIPALIAEIERLRKEVALGYPD